MTTRTIALTVVLIVLLLTDAPAEPFDAAKCANPRYAKKHENECAVATASEILAVSDYNGGRVLIYIAPFTTGMNASLALGAPNLTSQGSGGCGGGRGTRSNMGCVGPLAFIARQLWVADENFSRWLIFNSPFMMNMRAALEEGQPANVAFGGTFKSNDGGSAPTNQSHGGAVSRSPITGAVAGTDSNGSRVLIFRPPLASNGEAAVTVLGYPALDQIEQGPDGLPECVTGQNAIVGFHNANVSGFAPTASNLCYIAGVAFDNQGNLWVADTGNSRVLEYLADANGNFTSGQAAALVIGQPDFTSDNVGTAPDRLFQPQDLHFDAAGNLWVADTFNGRVLEYLPPFTTGMSASTVIGQHNFDSSVGLVAGLPCPASGGITTSTICTPMAFGFDLKGNMYVSDYMTSRALEFDAPLSTGMPASVVLGMPADGSNSTCVVPGDPFTCYQNHNWPDANSYSETAGIAAYPGLSD